MSDAAEFKNVVAALAAAQFEMGKVAKSATNPAFKSRYADLADVAAVVIPALAARGVAVMHYIVAAQGDKHNVMRTEFVHGESMTRVWCDVPLIVAKNDMQGMKSATTYAKRIGLESLSGVAPEDDDGNAAVAAAPKGQQRQEQQRPQYINETQFRALKARIEAIDGYSVDQACANFRVEMLEQLPAAKLHDAHAFLDAVAQKAAAAKQPPADTLGGDEIPY